MFRDPKQMVRWVAIAMALGLVCSSAAQAKKPPKDDDAVTYTRVELSSIEGWASAVNQLDGFVEVVGRLWDNSGEVDVQRAHYWMVDPAGNVLLSTDLASLPPTEPGAIVRSGALDVSNQGVVVGYQRDGSAAPRPLLWPDAASAPIELPLPEGTALGAMAASINDAGIVVGATYNPNDQSLVAWEVAVVDGAAIVLDTQTILSAPNVMMPQIVNSGYVSVSIASEPANYRAFRLRLDWAGEEVWEVAGSRTQLFDVYSQAAGINEEGTVCGSYNDGARWAFVMTVAGDLLDLPELPGGRIRGQPYVIRNFSANALNNASPLQVVGDGIVHMTETGEARGTVGVLWNVGISAVDLGSEASGDRPYLHDINDAGWIVGDAVDPEDFGVRRPAVLIPSQ
jgi:hypothetical protein